MKMSIETQRTFRVFLILIATALAMAAFSHIRGDTPDQDPALLQLFWMMLWWPFWLAQHIADTKYHQLCLPLLVVIPFWWVALSASIERMTTDVVPTKQD